MLKNIIVKSGEVIINVLVILGLISSLIAGLAAMSYSFIGGIMTIICGASGVIVVAFVVYLLIDIRDNIKNLNNKS